MLIIFELKPCWPVSGNYTGLRGTLKHQLQAPPSIHIHYTCYGRIISTIVAYILMLWKIKYFHGMEDELWMTY